MSSEVEIKTANLREALILQRQHFQHIETERYWLLSVYAAIIGVVLSIIFGTDINIDRGNADWLLVFLMVFTAIVFLINIRWMQTLALLGEKIKGIAATLEIKEEIAFEAPIKGIWKILRTRYLFLSFYVIVFFGLCALLITR